MSAIARFLDAFPTVEEVAQKIEELREEIRLLEGYKNARLLVVSRLPLEVLSLIFEYVAQIAKPEETPAYPSKRYGHWFSITGVCRLWRNVALNTPRLWGHIYAHTKPELARIFLERAKTAPLYLWSLLALSRRETVALWLCNASRLKEIRLAYYPSSSPDWFPLLETLNAPRLEILDLKSKAPKVFEFASNTDSNVAASLRHVKLHNCCFNFHTPLLSQLRSLRVEYDFHNGPQLQMFDVMLALKEMKYLESLELVYSLEFSGAPADLLELSIELPKLTRLCLQAKDPRVLLMLGNFSCPGLQSVTAVVCHGSTACLTSNDVVSTISHAFYTLVPGSEANWNTKLKVTHYGDELINSMIITPGSNSSVDPDLPSSTLTLRNPCDYSATHILLSFLPGNTPNVLDFGFESDRCREAYCDKDALKNVFAFLGERRRTPRSTHQGPPDPFDGRSNEDAVY
ncbi:hypothetical protein ONZ45_g4590 [Pleurotus djamor]|nr:hypothetical protein ONZ45_g4590 [Pleurotus djamor]